MDVSIVDKTILMTLRWPSNINERKAMYQLQPKRKRGLAICLAGTGAAVIAGREYLLYHFLKSDNTDNEQPLEAVLPGHPSGL